MQTAQSTETKKEATRQLSFQQGGLLRASLKRIEVVFFAHRRSGQASGMVNGRRIFITKFHYLETGDDIAHHACDHTSSKYESRAGTIA